MADMKTISRRLGKEIGKIVGRTPGGLLAAALFVEGESNEIVPQDKGVLINSSFALPSAKGPNPSAIVGYTAKYAPFVHEMPESNKFSKPDTGPKFLQKAAFGNIGTILKIIKNRVKV